MNTGNCNNLSLNLTLSRNSTDNPIFPRYGSEFSASLQITPPYSLFSKKDYSTYGKDNYHDAASMYKWIEYHKWKFKAKTYTALMDIQKCPVIMTRTEFGILGHFNKYKRSPFETFYVGGDGMTGYSYNYASETIALRGYENGSLTPYGSEGYAYIRLGAELRYPLMLENSTSIYALGFVEAGNAWNNVTDFNPFQLKRSAGFGVRIFLPMIGMMGIDWAYGFDKIDGSMQYSGSQFHFIIGQEFYHLKNNDSEETHFIRYAVSSRRRHGLSTEIRAGRYGVYPQADTFLSTGQPTDGVTVKAMAKPD